MSRSLRGQRVVIVNDVVNADSAVRGTLGSLAGCGAEPVAIGALAAYGPAARPLCARGVPVDGPREAG